MILHRLVSSRATRNKQKTWKQKSPISERLGQMLSDNRKLRGRSASSPTVLELENLKQAIEELNNDTSNDVAPFKRVIQTAAAVSQWNQSLTKTVETAGLLINETTARVFRQIKGLANYQHCCNRLARTAISHKTLFRSISLSAVTPAKAEKWPPKTRKKHYVHAEVQLLIHHESQETERKPRYIGVSKKACFLCYSFMRAYNSYVLPETHGEVTEHWTIPDRQGYSGEIRSRLNKALRMTMKDVNAALIKSRARNGRFGPLTQSPSHSIIFSLRSISTSTIKPVVKVDSGVDLEHGDTHSTSSDQSESSSGASSRESIGLSSSKESIRAPSDVLRSCLTNDQDLETYDILSHDWLRLYVPSKLASAQFIATRSFAKLDSNDSLPTCNISQIFEPLDQQTAAVIEVSNLPLSEALTLQETRPKVLSVVFRHASHEDIALRFSRA